jgi:3-oxoacyl-[acyl-carrier-protein] synthase II
MGKEIAITGIGVLSPIGIGRDTYWNALAQGKTGFGPVSLFDTAPFKVNVGGEISDFDPEALLGKKGLRTLDRSTRLLSSAAHLALEDANLSITDENTYSTGVAVGTTFGSLHSISQFDREGLIEGPRYVNPSFFSNTVINSPASQVSIRYKVKGFNTTISTGFCSALDAISYAADFIRLERADIVLAGAVEELCEESFLGFHELGYLSGMDGSEPICCPFDARRNGIILSEGAAVLVLEDSKHALKRGANIIATVKGHGNCFDPSAEMNFAHSGKGLLNAVKSALENSELKPDDIDCISSSANSTRGLDRLETNVIKEVFGEYAYSIPINSVKSMIGETFSASGMLAAAAGACSIRDGLIPQTVNYHEKDADCDLAYVTENMQEAIGDMLVVTTDPYGHNSAVVIGKNGG